MIADIPETFILGALSFDCSVTDLTQEQTLLMTGFDGKEGISVIFPVAEMAASATALTPNIRVQIERRRDSAPRNYAIVTVEKSIDNVSYTLMCKADHRN